jgi:hypothetical protein
MSPHLGRHSAEEAQAAHSLSEKQVIRLFGREKKSFPLRVSLVHGRLYGRHY